MAGLGERIREIIVRGIYDDDPSSLMVRAILDAMREPSPEMVLAADVDGVRSSADAWRAMIDFAKQEFA